MYSYIYKGCLGGITFPIMKHPKLTLEQLKFSRPYQMSFWGVSAWSDTETSLSTPYEQVGKHVAAMEGGDPELRVQVLLQHDWFTAPTHLCTREGLSFVVHVHQCSTTLCVDSIALTLLDDLWGLPQPKPFYDALWSEVNSWLSRSRKTCWCELC